MKIPALAMCCLCLWSQSSFAQAPDHQIGLQVGNNLSLPNARASSLFQEQFLLRYSIGVLGRRKLKKGFDFDFMNHRNKGAIAIDYGLQVIFKGYNYRFGQISSFTDQIRLEIPLHLALYNERNVFLPRKWWRKGIAAYSRLGFKLELSKRQEHRKTSRRGSERVDEQMLQKPLNVLWSMSIGLLQNFKNGRSTSFEISGNLGLLRNTRGSIRYENSETLVMQEEHFWDAGSYFSAQVTYLFGNKGGWLDRFKKVPPRVYNPRFL